MPGAERREFVSQPGHGFAREGPREDLLGPDLGDVDLRVREQQHRRARLFFGCRHNQEPPPLQSLLETPAFLREVAKQVESLVSGPAGEPFLDDAPQRSGVAVGLALLQPFAGLAIDAAAVQFNPSAGKAAIALAQARQDCDRRRPVALSRPAVCPGR